MPDVTRTEPIRLVPDVLPCHGFHPSRQARDRDLSASTGDAADLISIPSLVGSTQPMTAPVDFLHRSAFMSCVIPSYRRGDGKKAC